ncbi:hypothetical protein DSO57_1006923 [Entomophthora muscae]|uniref:Uncharacterized protein n=1 Tax=Entomophthora muscae TaxID=34485 RepID=A0ACC2SWC7_9FUNG|nr:hypothetical protein DSO57_1006923 [Entomophthora muscae]
MGRRNLTKQILGVEIELQTGDIIGRVLEPRGKNIHAVEFCEPKSSAQEQDEQNKDVLENNDPIFSTTLCLLPPKFRNLVWVKRGGYVVIRLYTEKDGKRTADSKIGGTIEHVLFPYHIKRLKLENKWPVEFQVPDNLSEDDENNSSTGSYTNPNHRQAVTDSSSEEE